MIKIKTCFMGGFCPEECDHPYSYLLTYEELKLLYDDYKNKYIHYENVKLINLVQEMSREIVK